MENIWHGVVTIATGIIGVAILSVIVSKNAQTPQVLTAAGNAFGGALRAATSPVSGGYNSLSLPDYNFQ